jgi:hypothetical protein
MPAGVEGMCVFNDLRFSTLECNYITKMMGGIGENIFFPPNEILFNVIMVAVETCNFSNDL